MTKRNGSPYRDACPHPSPCWCAECRRAYNVAYRVAYREHAKAEVPCQRCGKMLWRDPFNRQRFCSKRCRLDKVERLCEWCAKVFFVGADATARRFCSTACQRLHVNKSRRKRRITRECPWCFAEFECSENSLQEFCSPRHRGAFRQHALTWRSPDRCALPVCVDCRRVFSASPVRIGNRLPRCNECQATESFKLRKATRQRVMAPRRAAVNSGERFSVFDLAERDGWGCYRCGRRTATMRKVGHPLKATVDHLIPIAEGGEHTMRNCRVCCWQCNMEKGARAADTQLILC